MKSATTILFITLIFTKLAFTQMTFNRDTSLIFQENGVQFTSALAGGINSGQFSNIDLNIDGIMDLVIFDKAGDKLKVKVLEVKAAEQKVRVGLRQTQPDPFDWFNDKKVKQAITVKIISADNKGLVVRPEGCEMDFIIKKSAIAINAADARPARFTGGERIDCAIAELDLEKRKATLSIKLLEEIERKDALEKYGAEGSGKNLPFSSLSDDLEKKKKEDE